MLKLFTRLQNLYIRVFVNAAVASDRRLDSVEKIFSWARTFNPPLREFQWNHASSYVGQSQVLVSIGREGKGAWNDWKSGPNRPKWDALYRDINLVEW